MEMKRWIVLLVLHSDTVKKVSNFPVPSRDVINQTLPSGEYFNYSRPGRVTSRLETGKSLTFFTV